MKEKCGQYIIPVIVPTLLQANERRNDRYTTSTTI
jgi:hypothetical protein